MEAELQRIATDRLARDPDELHDLLRRVGDLDLEELRARSAADPDPWLATLAAQRRASQITVGGASRWIAAEDAALYADAALPDLLRRYARTHGPFATEAVAARFGLPATRIAPALAELEAAGVLMRGELRADVAGQTWCDADVWRQLKRRTLAKARNEVAPVDAATFARFLGAWHGLGEARSGPRRLEETIDQLEGLPVPWSSLSRALLPARVADFKPSMLDMLCASGAIVWVGCGAIGTRDGRIALYRRAHLATLLPAETDGKPDAPVHQALIAHLERRGASFLTELRDATAPASAREVEGALWDLVWAGVVTNDTFAPLRALGRGAGSNRRARDDLAGGRWSLVRSLRDPATGETERALARASSCSNATVS